MPENLLIWDQDTNFKLGAVISGCSKFWLLYLYMFPIYFYHVCFTDKYNNQHAYYIFIIIEFNQELDITKIAVRV